MDKRPNIVFVFPDQHRQQAMGFMNQDPVITPNIDRFRTESTFLSHCSATRPVCSPYRAMLFTGKYPYSNGVYLNAYSDTLADGCYLKPDERCFGDVLKDHGYACGYIGKLHLDRVQTEPPYHYGEGPRGGPGGTVWDAYTPPKRRHGFDFWYSYGCCDQHMSPHYWTGEGGPETVIEVDEWSTKHETDVAVAFLENTGGGYRDPDKPFALVVSYNPPHPPYDQFPQALLEPYADRTPEQMLNRPNVDLTTPGGKIAREHARNYFAMVTGVDAQFGRILQTLRDEGLADDTIVIFTSDHGEMLGSHGRMQKSVWWNESLLVPLLIRWPGKVAANATDDLLIGAADLYPTLLGLCGLHDAIPPQVQGIDYAPALLGEACGRPSSSLYIMPRHETAWAGREPDCRGVRTHRHMFVVEKTDSGGEILHLYDDEADPYQMHDIAGDRPDLVADLRRELDGWLERTDDPWRRGK